MKLETCEMHTGGEPLRIIESGYPDIPGGTLLEKRSFIRQNLDHLRKLLMWEPRGHFDMYGALLVPVSRPEADLAVIFMHNEGYSTMCGHACIALARYAVDKGLVRSVTAPETKVTIECPCGLVECYTDVTSGHTRFVSVPAFVFQTGI